MITADILPAIFVGHGNPMNAVSSNKYTAAWQLIGDRTPKPRAILSISAHWFGPGSAVTISSNPRTIHDFGGFPRELFEIQYPAPGDPELAGRVLELLSPMPARLDDSWGLDHGTWSVLVHAYASCDVPVVQLRIDELLPAAAHYEMGRKLAPLRSEGILIIGSGNLVHNLEAYAWGRHVQKPYDWAIRFEAEAKELLVAGAHGPLIDYENFGPDARLAVPTPEHYFPLLYVIGTTLPTDAITFPVEGVDGGSISMLTVQIG